MSFFSLKKTSRDALQGLMPVYFQGDDFFLDNQELFAKQDDDRKQLPAQELILRRKKERAVS